MKGLRSLPSIDRLLRDERLQQNINEYSRPVLLSILRQTVEEFRQQIQEGGMGPDFDEVVEAVLINLKRWEQGRLRPLINATGVIIHTNLGRAPLAEDAAAAMSEVTTQYCNLEYDLELGERGSRQDHIEALLREVTGAEGAMVVNNNAAAVLLALTLLAKGKEVLVSRGQAVEIGGGFRIPDVLKQSGATLVEVGTTNRTYIKDFEAAIGPESGLLLNVHSSNFRVIGFTASVEIEKLARLGNKYNLPVINDLGSGALIDTASFGLAHEPMAQESVAAGATLTCFSGDKLLGGPQAGIIVGKRDFVEGIKRHPLSRAIRIDKASLAALAVTLLHYLRGEALQKIPVWRMIATPLEQIAVRANDWATAVSGCQWAVSVVRGESTVGGGSLPGETLTTRLLSISAPSKTLKIATVYSLPSLVSRLRDGPPAIIGRIDSECLLLDPRTVLPNQDEQLVTALKAALLSLRPE